MRKASATPAKAACEVPAPIKESPFRTTKTPMTEQASPIKSDARNARCMNPYENISNIVERLPDMMGVVDDDIGPLVSLGQDDLKTKDVREGLLGQDFFRRPLRVEPGFQQKNRVDR